MLKVYTANAMRHAEKWRALRESYRKVEFTALWPFEPDVEPLDVNCTIFWERDYADVFRSDAVLVYAEPTDRLRGALVEAGMGIALDKFVIVVGEHSDYGTWQFHPRVNRAKDLEHALWMAEYLGRKITP